MHTELQALRREDNGNKFVCTHIDDCTGQVIAVDDARITNEISVWQIGSGIVTVINNYGVRNATRYNLDPFMGMLSIEDMIQPWLAGYAVIIALIVCGLIRAI